MKSITRPAAASLLLLIALTITAVSQTKKQAPPKTPPKPAAAQTPAPTFDTLVPTDSYFIYGEIRGVGQMVKSSALTEILEPILKLAGPPKEFRSILKWLDAHAEEVMTSRLLVATWAGNKDLPEAIIALEFASAEEAAKFATPLNEFLPTVLPPRPVTPSPDNPGQTSTTPKPNYYLQQAGTLVLLSPKPLNLKKLKPAGSKPLTEEVNFRAARNRLNSEPVFVFVDLKGMERQSEEQRKRFEEERRLEEERLKKENAARGVESEKMEEAEELPPPDDFEVNSEAKLGVVDSSELKDAARPDALSTSLNAIGASLFSIQSKWPDAVGLALSFENDSFDLRALFINDAGDKGDPIPFMPMLIPGPPIVPETPNILPADTELFVSMSLDLPQIYTLLSKPRANSTFTYTSHGKLQNVKEAVFESPFAALEKQLKMNLKDDLLPLLGSEIAIRLPVKDFDMLGIPRPGPMPITTDKTPPPSMAPAVLISVKDKEALRALLPRLIDSLGFKGASALAQTERREDTEMVSFLNTFSYAFVGNFLVLSGEPATTRHIVDSYLKHETLAADGQFRSYTRWQPRPLQGQVYISPALMESYKSWAEQPSTRVSEQTRAFLTRMSMVAQPISYSLSNEGLGPLHEVHLPKNLVLMAIAGISAESNPPTTIRNERMAIGMIYTISGGQEQYKNEKGNGSYGSLEQLIAAELVPKEMIDNSGYRFEVTVSGDKFEISATPLEYGKTGNMSYFMDHTRTIRGADRNGAAATSSDPPIY